MVVDDEAYAELLDLIGPVRTRTWVEAFMDELSTSLPASTPVDNVKLFEEAHRLGGRAGLVGCMDLVEACQILQRACRMESDTTDALNAARREAGIARAALDRILAGSR